VKFGKAKNTSTLRVCLSTKAVTGDVLCSMGSTLNPAPTRCAGRTLDFQFLGHLRRVWAQALKQPLPYAEPA
jgi:hypothetical protein